VRGRWEFCRLESSTSRFHAFFTLLLPPQPFVLSSALIRCCRGRKEKETGARWDGRAEVRLGARKIREPASAVTKARHSRIRASVCVR
jgi:hypothetical protein